MLNRGELVINKSESTDAFRLSRSVDRVARFVDDGSRFGCCSGDSFGVIGVDPAHIYEFRIVRHSDFRLGISLRRRSTREQ